MRICVYGGEEAFQQYLRLPKGWELVAEEPGVFDMAVVCGGAMPKGVVCTTLLLWENALPRHDLQAQQVISCGFSARNSLSLSSVSTQGAVLSVQRAIPCPDGRCILPQDIPLPAAWAGLSAAQQAMLAGIALLLGTMKLP